MRKEKDCEKERKRILKDLEYVKEIKAKDCEEGRNRRVKDFEKI